MKCLRIILSGPLSALSIFVISAPFWWVPFAGLSVFLVPVWLILWVIFELIWILRRQSPPSRILTHLCWGPLMTLLIFIAVTLSYDTIRIHQSRQDLKNYIYYGSTEAEFSSLELHTDYRGWCGNGVFSADYANYIDTAVEGFQSESPEVRMRALKASHYLAFQASDERYEGLIQSALNDGDAAVRALACSYMLNPQDAF
jgi:hypothetical protein